MYTPTLQLNQSELDRRANELAIREQELNRQQQLGTRTNNFPPLPTFCPCKPCFYHAIDTDIPVTSQKSCRIMFYIWQFYVVTLLANFISAFALLVGGGTHGGDSGGSTFGVSLLYLVAFTPCSFVGWYRPIYKALKNDNSFNYMVFFFIFFFQIVVCVISALGIPAFGTVGWINGISQLTRGSTGVGVLMMITGVMWTLLAAAMVLYYKKIHTAYRTSGASFQKAQSELVSGLAANPNVQNIAVESVRAGISSNLRK